MASEPSNYPDYVFVAYDEDFSAQTYDIAVSLEPGNLVGRPVKYIRHDLNTRSAPAATDTGLETYAHDNETLSGLSRNEHGPWCLRSQDEELLAAERAEKEQAKGDLTRVLVHFVREHFPENTTFKPFDDLIGLITQFDNASTIAREYASRIHVLEADNAAQDARIKELEKLNALVVRQREEANAYGDEGHSRTEALEAKLAAANDLVVRAQVIIPDHYVNWHRDARAVLGGKPS